MEQTGRLDRDDGVCLAWAHLEPSGDRAALHPAAPTVVFLPGFKSDMSGSKALAVRDFCAEWGLAMLRLDYSGHGASDGAFTDGTIGRWAEDARAVILAQVTGDVLLIGSSMGGWIGLLLARAFGARVAGFIGIAAAPDFTETLMWESMTPDEKSVLMSAGQISVPSEYGEPYVITRTLIEEGRRHLLLGSAIPLTAPVRLLQGQCDADVPWETALKLAATIESSDVQTILIKDGDHRLSRPTDLALLRRTLAALLGKDAC